jgi:rubredoxin
MTTPQPGKPFEPNPGGMFCRRCSADLRGVGTRRCPRCGHRFNPEVPLTYAEWPFDPRAYVRSQRRLSLVWLGLVVAGIIGVMILALLFAAAALE